MTPIVSHEHREVRKKIILDAAKEVFTIKGYNRTTMQDIIEQSGISRGGVYTYFLNTEDIFLELMKKRDLESTIDLVALYGEDPSSWKALTKIFESFQKMIESNEDGFVVAIYEYYFTTGYISKKHIPSIESRVSYMVNILAEIINKGIELKEFNPIVSPEDIARTIISICDGIYVNSVHLGAEKIKLRNQFKVFELFLKQTLYND